MRNNIKMITPGLRKRRDVMRIAILSLLLILATHCLVGCAAREGFGPGTAIKIGQPSSELVARVGQPQEILAGPQGSKVYVYRRYRFAQIGATNSGVWDKPEEFYYYIDSHGVISKIDYYPYGKRKFIFPSGEKKASEPQVTALPSRESAARTPTATTPSSERAMLSTPTAAAPVAIPTSKKQAYPLPEKVAKVSKPTLPTKAASSNMETTTRLELGMKKEEVHHLLGVPERTEGFRMGGKSIITWFYNLKNQQGRQVSTPLVFEDGRLCGWGESYYLHLRKVLDQKP
jgi:hypothetical protein